ncbi:hypothetical protein [Phaeobacter sp.]|uniref:hypothetical protein n=1 Tax=Phaeobacter sp. TaxID=1902409 RepID=UPI0025F1A652|nr:hypothetical protein [Phaeobacter sp.]
MGLKTLTGFALVCGLVLVGVDYDRQLRLRGAEWGGLSLQGYAALLQQRVTGGAQASAAEDPTAPRLVSANPDRSVAEDRIARHLPQIETASGENRGTLLQSMVNGVASGVSRNLPGSDLFGTVGALLDAEGPTTLGAEIDPETGADLGPNAQPGLSAQPGLNAQPRPAAVTVRRGGEAFVGRTVTGAGKICVRRAGSLMCD